MKKILAVLVAVLLMLSLTACFNLGDISKDDPNLGIYNGVYVDIDGEKMPMDEVYEGENYIHLGAAGHCKFCLEGDEVKATWTLFDEDFTVMLEDERSKGTLKDGVIIIDFLESGIKLCFAKDEVDTEELVGSADESTELEDEASIGTDESSSAVDTPNIAGYYEIYSMQDGDEYFDYDTLEEEGVVGLTYVVLEPDGTGMISVFGDEYSLNYDEDTINVEGDIAEYTVDGDMLTISIEDVALVFMYAGQGIEDNTAGEGIADITGYYEIYAMDNGEEYVDYKTLLERGITGDTYIELESDGTGTIAVFGEEFALTYDEYALSVEGDDAIYSVDGDMLMVFIDEITLYFKLVTE